MEHSQVLHDRLSDTVSYTEPDRSGPPDPHGMPTGRGPALAYARSAERQAHGEAIGVGHVIEAVVRSFPLRTLALPGEFYPAHLSVALIDAVFRSGGVHGDGTESAAEPYCRRSGIARIRTDPWSLPSPEDQETLSDLIARFDELGMERMAGEVFRTDALRPYQIAARVEFVLSAARELRRVGVEVLQDLQALPFEEFETALGECAGFGETTTRLFRMYTGDDDFVWGDDCVREFVAAALRRNSFPAEQAKRLVRSCAYELILSPRYLDHQIWCHHSRRHMVASGP